MKYESITIYGEIRGNIWMPYAECTKEFSQTFTNPNQLKSNEWTGLRDAVCNITNDGDFRSAAIDWARIETVYIDGSKRIVIEKELKPTKLTEDCFYKD
jgi:hypothetical protein